MEPIKFKVTEPRQVNFTLTMTAPLEEWKSLCVQLDTRYPSWRLSAAIRKLIEHAGSEFSGEQVEIP
jgi:hypothetical protein